MNKTIFVRTGMQFKLSQMNGLIIPLGIRYW